MTKGRPQSVAVVHTGPVTIQPLKERFARLLPEVRVINLMDDSLLNDLRAAGSMTPAVMARMCQYFMIADAMGVDCILNACSSVGDTVPVGQKMVSAPIVRVDAAMAEQAVSMGTRIGVAATVRTTLDPTTRLIRETAAAKGKAVELVEGLSDGALDVLLAGRPEEHDRLVLETLKSLAPKVDVIALAQVSIARLVPSLGAGFPVPVLSSPDGGVAAVGEVLARLRKGE